MSARPGADGAGTDGGRRWYDRLLAIDRRWIYAFLAAAVLLPAVVSFTVPTPVSSEVGAVHTFVDSLQQDDVLFVAIDYDPSTLAELHPMTEAIITQAWGRGARIVMSCLSQFGAAMAQDLIERVAQEQGKTNGTDWVFLGYKPYPAITILAMGTDFRVPFPTDHYGTPLDSIPMMRDLHNYADVKAVIAIASGTAADFWIQYGNAKYGFPLALGVTGVMASDYYPYLQSGQIFGLIPGMKGAAEYEQLTGKPGGGSRGMPYQVATHIVILAFIVISNVGYVAQRAAARRAGETRP